MYIYIKRTEEKNTIYLVLRVSCYQSSAKYLHNKKLQYQVSVINGIFNDSYFVY